MFLVPTFTTNIAAYVEVYDFIKLEMLELDTLLV